jgi:hypothetical protein
MGAMKRVSLAVLAVVVVLAGCVADDRFDARGEVRRFDKMDAAKAAQTRTMLGDWRFLAWIGGPQQPTFVPGLTKDELHEFVESGRVGLDPYYFYGADGGKPNKEHAEIRDAKMRFTARVNRCIVESIRQRQGATPPPGK